MVSPHLPPDQAANALLPKLLGDRLKENGHGVAYVCFPPRYETGAGDGRPEPDTIIYVSRPPRKGSVADRLRIAQAKTAVEVLRKARKAVAWADVVHLHSNTFMNQAAAALAALRRRPYVLTHYGTEIWHHQPKAKRIDPFLWMNRSAAYVTYYSRRLLDRSLELGIAPPAHSVVYPAVGERFRALTPEERARARAELGLGSEPFLLNVKRLHPLAGQGTLIEAMPELLRAFPEARLWIAGEGEARAELEQTILRLGLGRSVRLLGLVDNRELPRFYAAADLFVLPSLLEAFPTVAAEALACGTPVLSTDHPGGLELGELFPEDVEVVPRRDAAALGEALAAALRRERRVSGKTLDRIEAEFRPGTTFARYFAIYERVARPPGGAVA
jgi:glycosyltransferase involved in cell wall biosynthesis